MTIFDKKKKRNSFVCGYCGRSGDKANEPNGEVKLIDGKPACAICRATRFSNMAKLIAADKIKHDTEKYKRERKSKKDALQMVKEIAYASQVKNEALAPRLKRDFFK
jgi:hypothetical protein